MGSLTFVPKLPIIDFSMENLKHGTNSWLSTSINVKQALEDYGCFVINYEKVALELHTRLFGALEDLFNLPIESKIKNKYDKPLNGYVGQIPILPLHESMGIDDATTLEGTQKFTNLMWPTGNVHFCESILSYSKLVAELDEMVMKMICDSYGVEKYYESHVGSITYLLRLLKNRAPKSSETNLGFVAHTDKSFITILHQNQVNGLEVETKNGDWIRVELEPSSFVVMAGDALMAWSNDRIHSPSHRVVIEGNETRYSVAQFSFGNGIVSVPTELVDEEHPLQYNPFNHAGFLHFFSTDEGSKSKCPIKAYCGV